MVRLGQGEGQVNRPLTEADIVEWEVHQTWVVLNKAKNDQLIEGSYYKAVLTAFEDINSNLEGTRGYAETRIAEDKRMSDERLRAGNPRQPLLQAQVPPGNSGYLNYNVRPA